MENKTLVHPKPIMIKGTRDRIIVEIGLHYTDTYNEQLLCYTNAVPNPDGGTHCSGFRGSLTRAINQYAKNNNLIKDKEPAITGNDVLEGLAAVVSVKHPDPRFESPDQGEADLARGGEHRGLGQLRGIDAAFRSEPETSGNGSSRNASWLPARARRRAKLAKRCAKARSPAEVCPANWRTAPSAIPR